MDLSILVPVKNESQSINSLVSRIDKSLKKAKISYHIIIIDDKSTDDTVKVIKSISSRYPITLKTKRGKPGKGYSLLEGARHAKGRMIAMIDGDLQYPPEAIPALYQKALESGIAIGNRNVRHTSLFRKIFSNISRAVISQFIAGLNVDTQTGLKVFRKDIIDNLNKEDITAWGIDIPLLITAKEMGYEIAEHDIVFSDRSEGHTKTNVVITAWQIFSSAIKIKFLRRKIFKITKNGAIGSGYLVNGKRFTTHTHLPLSDSALITATGWQKLLILLIISALAAGLYLNTVMTLVVVLAVLTAVYFADSIFSLYVMNKALGNPPELDVHDKDIEELDDSTLPHYTILCPLYKERDILPQFVKSISKLDWPKEKLEVMLLLEEDDLETQKAAEEINLPPYFSVVVVPNSQPKTKPKACNYGLYNSKGKYVVIYDAEDKPDKKQLKKAYLSFQRLGEDYICVQSKLNYYNSNQNLLTRLFTAEYSLWFELILPGFQSIETTIPLGGTSNHFRADELKKLHAWDPFNVTEDCDLGVRIYKNGYKTAIVNSTTLEEANSRLLNWIRQRSRWIKGYLQTYLVHLRKPIELTRSLGWHSLLFHLVIGLRITFILINPLLWSLTAVYFLFYDSVGFYIESLFPGPVYYTAVFTMVFGNLMYFFSYMIGVAKRGQWDLTKYVFLVPFYWMITSLAAVVSFYQLVVKPHYWEKTKHGLHLKPGKFSLIRYLKNFSFRVSINSDPTASSTPGKLNILLLNWRDTKHIWAGGAEVYVHELAKHWVGMGHNVKLFCGNDGRSKRNEAIDGVKIIRRGGFYTVYLWAAIYYITKLRSNTDIIIESGNGAPFFTTLYSRKPKILVLHHIHQEVFRVGLPKPLALLATIVESRLMPLFYKNISVVTVSESTKNDIANLGLSNQENIDIIPPGVMRQKVNGVKKTPYPSVIYLGRLKSYKNIDVAIKAIAKVRESFPDLVFNIAGDGEEYTSLRKLIAKLKLKKTVRLLGKVSEKQKYRYFTRSWLALQPSSFEGWGITVLEANSCSTPVISSDVKGLRDSVVNGKTGILVQRRSVDEWVYAIKSMLDNDTQRAEMSMSAKKWADSFSWEESATRFMDIIQKKLYQEEELAGLKKDIIPGSYSSLRVNKKEGTAE